MAQTISSSRGNTAYTADSTSSSALAVYTNGANPTRVIINSLAWLSGSASSNNTRFVLYLRNSGTTTNDIPVAGSSQNSIASMILIPGQIPVPGLTNTTQNTAFNLVTSSVSGTLANDVLMGSAVNAQNSGYSFCPKNIWMGPSDVLIVRIYTASSLAGTVVWNFTTITES